MSTIDEQTEVLPSDHVGTRDNSKSSFIGLWLLIGLLLPVAGMIPILLIESAKIASQPYMYFAPVATLAALIIYGVTCPIRLASRSRMRWSMLGVAMSSLLGTWSTFEVRPWPAHIAVVLVVTFWLLGTLGSTRSTRIIAIASLMLVAAGLPYGLDTLLLSFTEKAVGWSTSGMLELLSIANLQTTSGIQFEHGTVTTSEISSGIDSLFAYLAIGLAVVIIRRRSFAAAMVTLLLVPVFAIAGYVAKMSTIVFVQQSFGIDIGIGIGSAILSFVIFSLVCICILMWDISNTAFWEPLPSNVEPSKINSAYQFVATWPSKDVLTPTAGNSINVGVLALVGVASLSCFAMGGFAAYVMRQTNMLWDGSTTQLASRNANLPSISESFLPEEIGGFVRTKFERADGTASGVVAKQLATARYNRNSDYLSLSVRFPYTGWNDANSSVPRVAGNDIVDSELIRVESLHPSESTIERILLRDEFGTKSHGWIASIHTDGTIVLPSERTVIQERDLLSRLRAKDRVTPLSCFQIQLLVEPSRVLTDDEIASCFTLFIDTIPLIRANTVQALQGPAPQGEVR